MKYYLMILITCLLISCKNKPDIVKRNIADEAIITKFRTNKNDSINIKEIEHIKTIISCFNESEESPVKMMYDYKLVLKNDSINFDAISIKGNRFRYKGKSYISNKNIQNYIDNINL